MNTRTATEGYWLTQSSVKSEDERVYVKSVSGFGELDSLYREATDEEKISWEESRQSDPSEPELSAEEALGIITGEKY